jgi:hypothetical protein
MLLAGSLCMLQHWFPNSSVVGMQVADVPRSAPLKSRLMWPALALTAAMVTTQVMSGHDPTVLVHTNTKPKRCKPCDS